MALAAKLPMQRARTLVTAMTAARAAQLETSAFMHALEAARQQADPGGTAPAVFALRQSAKESHG